MSLADKLNLYFIDFNIIPLMVHENYLPAMANKASESGIMDKIASAADFISEGENISLQVFQN